MGTCQWGFPLAPRQPHKQKDDMSYSRVEYPRTSGTRSAGSRNQRTPQASYNPQPPNGSELGSEDAWSEEASASASAPAERTPQRSGSHYVLQPNPVKNEKLRRTAQEEETRYQQHRAEERERWVARLSQEGPRTLGGPAHSREELKELRQRQEREQQLKAKYAGVYRKQKREAYQQARKQREDEEAEKRKEIQREKALRLRAKQQVQSKEDLEDLRRKRLAHFEGTGKT